MAVHADALGRRDRRRRTDTVDPAGNGGGWCGGAATGLAGAGEGAERRIAHVWVVVVWQGEADQAVVVFEYLGVPLDGRLPVFVDTPFEGHLGLLHLARVWLGVVVVCLGLDALYILVVGLEPPLFEKPKVLKNVVACVLSDPSSGQSQ